MGNGLLKSVKIPRQLTYSKQVMCAPTRCPTESKLLHQTIISCSSNMIFLKLIWKTTMRQRPIIVRMRNHALNLISLKGSGALFMTKQWKLSSITARDSSLISDIMQNLIWPKIPKMIFNYYLQIFILEIMEVSTQFANRQWLGLCRLREEEALQWVITEPHAFLVNKMSNMISKIQLKSKVIISKLHKYNDILKT
jgi:hypothetical protein